MIESYLQIPKFYFFFRIHLKKKCFFIKFIIGKSIEYRLINKQKSVYIPVLNKIIKCI